MLYGIFFREPSLHYKKEKEKKKGKTYTKLFSYQS